MKIHLDKLIPAQSARFLEGHNSVTTQSCNWTGIQKGELIRRAEQAKFTRFITADKNRRHHQPLAGRKAAIDERATNDLGRLRVAAAGILEALGEVNSSDYRLGEVPWDLSQLEFYHPTPRFR